MTRNNFLAATALGVTLAVSGQSLAARADGSAFVIEGLPAVPGAAAEATAPDAFAFEIRAPGRPSARPALRPVTLDPEASSPALVEAASLPVPEPVAPAGPRLAGLGAVAPEAQAARPLWTRTGMLDLTFGRDLDEGTGWSEGRAAFFAQGPVGDGWTLTASADSGGRPLDELLDGLTGTERRDALARLHAAPGAPDFGDGSALLHPGGRDGRLFARIARDDSHLTFGQSRVSLADGDLIRAERSIYGLSGRHATETGSVEGFASREDALPETDLFDATGGASYRLAHRDVLPGTVQLSVERRDETGRLIERRQLVEGLDYSVNHAQGHVLLGRPLMGQVGRALFSDESDEITLRADYARPADGIDDLSTGLRARQEIGGGLSVGATALDEETGDARMRVAGVDATLEAAPGLRLTAELARSEGSGRAFNRSSDGGLSFSTEASGAPGTEATAWSLGAEADLAPLAGTEGTASAWVERREAGFAGTGAAEPETLTRAGAEVEVAVTEATRLGFGAESVERGTERRRELRLDLAQRIDPATELRLGLERETLSGGGQNGTRSDAALRVERRMGGATAHLFAEGTLAAEGDLDRYHRYGAGLSGALTDRLSAEAELGFGSAGTGLEAGLSYARDDGEVYLRHRVVGDATDDIAGHGLVLGQRRDIGDDWSIFAEQDLLLGGAGDGHGQSYGLTWAPDGFSLDLAATIDAETEGRTRRTLSFGAAVERPHGAARARIELHEIDVPGENGDGVLIAARSRQLTDDLGGTLRARVEYAHERRAGQADGEYAEAGLSYALRPVMDDDLIVVLSYDMRADLDRGAVGAADSGTPLQRSHVVSADLDYRLGRDLSVGAKYGVRLGELATDRAQPDWQDSTAHVFVLRGEWSFAENWDLLLEYRALYQPETEALDHGVLAAPYYRISDNARIGAGYDFGSFSSDLTDLDHSRGAFVNAIWSF
ncbi:hypothetical protein FHS00_001257 [Limimaricola variabilis]|uniref:TonB-dependent receptor n=1 Tax=Limimaricola variabilis TaxID=1492771 RepID=A0ABR6HMQ6_9RHOB|nr:hypothetical protein [Limimaricola variabilis]MBB3711686.1 hypothetical protein [Limimaricola variabilis]